jgi:Flp pilus assembly protein CpaB
MKRLIVVLVLAIGAGAIAYASLKKTSSRKQAIEKKIEKQEKKKECKKKCLYS